MITIKGHLKKSIHIRYQRSMTTTVSALSSETSSTDGGRFTTTYTAFEAREPREAEAGVITLLLA